jgi:hypothetical protein
VVTDLLALAAEYPGLCYIVAYEDATPAELTRHWSRSPPTRVSTGSSPGLPHADEIVALRGL